MFVKGITAFFLSSTLIIACATAANTIRSVDNDDSDKPSSAELWSYYEQDDYGPSNWHKLEGFEKCDGTMQSPIDISSAVYDKTLSSLNFKYSDVGEWDCKNNGHTAECAVPPTETFNMNFNGEDYKLAQFHLHWGPGNTGSEHTIQGKQYPVEVHLVHHRASFNGLGEALGSNQKGDLAVVGIMVRMPEENSNEESEIIFQQLSKVATQLKKAKKHKTANMFVSALLESEVVRSEYLTYEGSLTTPTCNEVVRWILLKKTFLGPQSLLTNLQKLKQKNGEKIGLNYRPTQPLNNRVVNKSYYDVTNSLDV